MQRKNLKSGAWADLREPADVPERLRRPVRRIQMLLAQNTAFSGVVKDAAAKGAASVRDIAEDQAVQMVTAMGEQAFDLMDQLNDRAVLARVAGWSFGPDVTLDALLDLTAGDYDELRELCADGALDSGPDFSPSQAEDSPTGPSTASA